MNKKTDKRFVMEEREGKRSRERWKKKNYRYLGGGKTWKWPEDATASAAQAGATGQRGGHCTAQCNTAGDALTGLRRGPALSTCMGSISRLERQEGDNAEVNLRRQGGLMWNCA